MEKRGVRLGITETFLRSSTAMFSVLNFIQAVHLSEFFIAEKNKCTHKIRQRYVI
jgi:hypothetical protein